ncbi:MAG: HEAT repeat domain-containing protein [Planctomycetes bacterium]|nr:HEAT repeat domain-containing protein [Planctomycetota bacterium]
MSDKDNPSDYQACSSAEQFELLLAAPDRNDDDSWDVIHLLQNRAEREILDRSLEVLSHSDPAKRALGADLLAQFGNPERAFPEQSLSALRRLLATEREPGVLDCAATAFVHNNDPEAVPLLLALRKHAWPIVRLAVVQALGSQDETPEVVAALAELCRDPAPDVRDWATFALGSLMEVDTPEVREVLLARAEDTDSETRGEALVGLADRGDQRVLEYVIDALEDEEVGTLAVEAAWKLGMAGYADSELWSALVDLTSWWDVDVDLLTRATKSCEPGAGEQ